MVDLTPHTQPPPGDGASAAEDLLQLGRSRDKQGPSSPSSSSSSSSTTTTTTTTTTTITLGQLGRVNYPDVRTWASDNAEPENVLQPDIVNLTTLPLDELEAFDQFFHGKERYRMFLHECMRIIML
jgi:hypothetical protein